MKTYKVTIKNLRIKADSKTDAQVITDQLVSIGINKMFSDGEIIRQDWYEIYAEEVKEKT